MCKPCGNHMKTIWGPCGNHMKTMWGTCANHMKTMWGQLQTMCKPCAKPHENHVGAMWKPCANHVQTMCKPCANRANHAQFMSGQCPGGPKSQIPRPNQGFQMKFGWLTNTWSSKNATCRGDIICYKNVFFTCIIFMFSIPSNPSHASQDIGKWIKQILAGFIWV